MTKKAYKFKLVKLSIKKYTYNYIKFSKKI